MFDNKSKVECYRYSIDLSVPIQFFCNLVADIGHSITSDFIVENVFEDSYLNEIGIKLSTDNTIEDLASEIAAFYNKHLLNEVDLTKLNVFFIYKSKNIFFSYGDIKLKDLKTGITTLLKNEKLFDILIKNLKDQKLRRSLEKFFSLKFEELFYKIVELNKLSYPSLTYIPLDFLNPNLVSTDYIEEEEIWLNKQLLAEVFQFKFHDNVSYSALTTEVNGIDEIIGIQCNDVVFPITNFDFKEVINQESYTEYYWLLFKQVFKEDQDRKQGHVSELLEKFKKETKSAELSLLLSFLENNLSTSSEVFCKFTKYEDFFEEVSKLNELKDIDSFDFYVSNTKGVTALGVYTNQKIGTNYNLLHWVKSNGEDGKLEFYRNIERPISKNVKSVHALKPELAFYFITNYFEDFLEEAIKYTTDDYLKNFKLYVNNSDNPLGEFDFLIKSNGKLCFIEAKTKLTNYYIESYLEKCDQLIKNLKPLEDIVKIEFYLISAYSDDTCESKRYFIDETVREGYNGRREGLKTRPYFFEVPIPQHKSTKLTCIAEPEFDKMKLIIRDICQK